MGFLRKNKALILSGRVGGIAAKDRRKVAARIERERHRRLGDRITAGQHPFCACDFAHVDIVVGGDAHLFFEFDLKIGKR